MRSLAWLSALAAAAALSACGGSGDSAPAPARLALQASVPEPVYSQPLSVEIFRAINAARANAGIGLLSQQSHLDQAAAAHMAYLVRNNSGGHSETPGMPLFTGVTHTDRLAAAGYTGGTVWELVAGSGFVSGSEIVVSRYMSGPYHRTPLLVADSTSVGIDSFKTLNNLSFSTLLLGFTTNAPQQLGASMVVVWPYAGMPDSPILGCCDTPNPFPDERPVWGYPVSVQGPFQSRIAVSSFTLSGPGGTTVAAQLLTANNDPHGLLPESNVTLIPLAPLAKLTTYTATTTGTLDGVAFNKTWSFTTRAN